MAKLRTVISIIAGFVLVLSHIAVAARQSIPSRISILDWSPDGNRMAIGYDNGIFEILNLIANTSVFPETDNSQVIRAAKWSPTGNLIAYSRAYGIVLVYDVSNSQFLSFPSSSGIGTTTFLSDNGIEDIKSISWNPTGEFFVATGQKYTGSFAEKSIIVWRISTGDVVLRLNLHLGQLNEVAWSPDGNYFAVGDSEGEVTIFDAVTGQKIRTISEGYPTDVAWDPTGNFLAVSNLACQISFLAPSNWQVTSTFSKTEPTFCKSSAWSPDGSIFLIADDTQLRYLDPNTGQTLDLVQIPGRISALAWNPNGTQLAYAYSTVATDLTSTYSPMIFATPPNLGITPTVISTATATVTYTPTAFATSTATKTPTPTGTPTPTFTLTPTPTQVSSSLKLQYYPESTTRTQYVEAINPQLNIVNLGGSAVNLSTLKIRYYFTKDSSLPLEGQCDWTALPDDCDNVTVTTHTLTTPVTGADSYIEVSFTGGSVAANSETQDIIVRANKQDWSDFDQNNDYSFDPTSTSDTFIDWTKVTLYQNDVLIWGTEPQ